MWVKSPTLFSFPNLDKQEKFLETPLSKNTKTLNVNENPIGDESAVSSPHYQNYIPP